VLGARCSPLSRSSTATAASTCGHARTVWINLRRGRASRRLDISMQLAHADGRREDLGSEARSPIFGGSKQQILTCLQ
jgi:hypothetical protein